MQVNETHTFSPTTLNEAQFGFVRSYGISPGTGLFTVPVISVVGESAGYGDGFAFGNFTQHNYHWRDVLTRIHHNHVFKLGYDGSHGDNIFDGTPAYEQPTFGFNTVLDLARSLPYTESGLAYSPLTGLANNGFAFDYVGLNNGVFFEDTWKVSPRLTINYGIRYDYFGNIKPSQGTVATNFILGSGTFEQQVANGVVRKQSAVLNGAIDNVWSPRAGIAYDLTGHGTWVLRGGFGVYHDWPTVGEVSESVSLYSSPYGYEVPTFYSNGTTVSTPIFALGNSNKPPFGFPYPAIGTSTIDSHGGLVGTQISVGGIDPNLGAPTTYTYAGTLAHSLTKDLVASVGYMGSHSTSLITGVAYANLVNAVATGVDINTFPGSLLENNDVLVRLNSSFGSVYYSKNEADANYNALVIALQGRFTKLGFVNASYTRSRAYDDDLHYPVATDISQYYGPGSTNAPNRFSLSWNYALPGARKATMGAIGRLTNGWSLSAFTVLQSGYPFTVYTSAPFIPLLNANGTFARAANGNLIPAPNSGDYNADGNDYDYPNVPNYNQPRSRNAYLSGLFPASNFTAPTPGTEGNEAENRYSGPGFADTDVALLKSTTITERFKLDLRVDFFNSFNRVNLSSFVSDLASSQFGRATGQLAPRWLQVAVNFKF